MQLADDHPLGAINDERPLVCHQGNFTKIHLLLLHIPDANLSGLFIPFGDDQLHHDTKRVRIRHPPLAAFFHIILLFIDQALSALFALDPHAAQAFILTAIASPCSDLVPHILQERHLVEVADREDTPEDRLKAAIVALLRGSVLLQESIIGFLLDFDQIRNIDDGGNPGVILALTVFIKIQRHVDLCHAGHLLLDFDCCPNLFKLFLQFVRFVLADLLLDRFGSPIDQIFRLFQP